MARSGARRVPLPFGSRACPAEAGVDLAGATAHRPVDCGGSSLHLLHAWKHEPQSSASDAPLTRASGFHLLPLAPRSPRPDRSWTSSEQAMYILRLDLG